MSSFYYKEVVNLKMKLLHLLTKISFIGFNVEAFVALKTGGIPFGRDIIDHERTTII